MTAELDGLPAVPVITDRFTATADLMARVLGLPGYRYAVVLHPFASDSPEELLAKADDAVRQSVDLLTKR